LIGASIYYPDFGDERRIAAALAEYGIIYMRPIFILVKTQLAVQAAAIDQCVKD